MLLGHACRLQQKQTATPQHLLLSIYGAATLDSFPESIYYKLVELDDALSLAKDGVFGSLDEVTAEITAFLANYEKDAPLQIPHESSE